MNSQIMIGTTRKRLMLFKKGAGVAVYRVQLNLNQCQKYQKTLKHCYTYQQQYLHQLQLVFYTAFQMGIQTITIGALYRLPNGDIDNYNWCSIPPSKWGYRQLQLVFYTAPQMGIQTITIGALYRLPNGDIDNYNWCSIPPSKWGYRQLQLVFYTAPQMGIQTITIGVLYRLPNGIQTITIGALYRLPNGDIDNYNWCYIPIWKAVQNTNCNCLYPHLGGGIEHQL